MLAELLETALDAADLAARVHANATHTRSSLKAVEKGQSDFVSEVDLAAQAAALDLIRERHPAHQILAEEEDDARGLILRPEDADPSVPLWVVDPLDGTTNFLHGHPIYASSVGVVQGTRPLAGAVVSSATGDRWWAMRGGGAFHNGAPISTSTKRELRTALIGTGFPFKSLPLLPDYLVQMDTVLRNTAGIRRLGAASMDLCYLASGWIDGFWELSLGPWDVAAGIVIVQEAGGVVSDLHNGDVDFSRSEAYLAANSTELHDELRALVLDQGAALARFPND